MLDFERIKTDLELVHKDGILPPISITADFPAENKLIILIDIVGFSKGSTREQVYKIYTFEHYVKKHVLSNIFNFNERIVINQFIPTGDGCYIVADECDPMVALDFLITLVSGFQYLNSDDENPWALRASAIYGECVPFIDLAHHKNYIGEGMNEAARILAYGQSALEKDFKKSHPDSNELEAKQFSRNSIYVGSDLSQTLQEYEVEGRKIFQFNEIADKHGKKRNITVLQNLK